MKARTFFTVILMSFFTMTIYAQDNTALRQKQYNLDEQLAIDGYDPVTYFKLNKAVKGKKELSFNYQGVIYRFSTVENREEFKKNPAHYEPEYGGWCAYAMGAKGEKVSVDPETFKIINGRLYLFYNSFFNNTLKTWNKDENNLKAKADANWKRIYH